MTVNGTLSKTQNVRSRMDVPLRMVYSPAIVLTSLFLLGIMTASTDAADSLAEWRDGVTIRALPVGDGNHSAHAYQNVSPESPDGRWVLFYASKTAEGHEGRICLLERATGRIETLVGNVTAQDIHRQAAQQWACGEDCVVFQDLRDGKWVVACIDLDSRKERVLAENRQIGMSSASSDLVPLHGLHWAPGEHRDIELLNIRTGEIATAVTLERVRRDHPKIFEIWDERMPGKPKILFFGILSPDHHRILLKLSILREGGLRDHRASKRPGLFCYGLEGPHPLYVSKWAHPAWHPDSRHVIRSFSGRPVIVDCLKGRESVRRLEKVPLFPSSHPVFGPRGRLFATDARAEPFGGPKGSWCIVVGDVETEEHVVLHTFDQRGGAVSWRRSHPHPVFSPDGRRIYFNVSSDRWTRLCVAEKASGASGRAEKGP